MTNKIHKSFYVDILFTFLYIYVRFIPKWHSVIEFDTLETLQNRCSYTYIYHEIGYFSYNKTMLLYEYKPNNLFLSHTMNNLPLWCPHATHFPRQPSSTASKIFLCSSWKYCSWHIPDWYVPFSYYLCMYSFSTVWLRCRMHYIPPNQYWLALHCETVEMYVFYATRNNRNG